MIKVSLNPLIENIDDPKMIDAVLSLYQDLLIEDDGYTLENLIPALYKKLRDTTTVFSEIMANHRHFVSMAEKLADKSTDVLTHSSGLLAIATALDRGSSIEYEISDMEKTVVILCQELENFMQQTIEQQFEMQSSSLFSLGQMLEKLNAMLPTRHFETMWAWKKLHAIHDDIQKHADSVSVYTLQPCITVFYTHYRDCAVRAESVDKKLLKLKNENKMVSGEMLTRRSELAAQLEQLGALILKAVQAANKLDRLRLNMSKHLKIYLLLSTKLEFIKAKP